VKKRGRRRRRHQGMAAREWLAPIAHACRTLFLFDATKLYSLNLIISLTLIQTKWFLTATAQGSLAADMK
jgi:hypothetical protein